jgi:P-type Ca2+ transporter type 2C
VPEAADALATDPESGLSAEEAAQRLERFGPNSLELERPPGPWRLFFSQFNDFMILVLMFAAVVAAAQALHSTDIATRIEPFAILAIVFINGILGFVQASRAERALALLKEMSSPRARAIRDGAEVDSDARRLVPGDLVALACGDSVPADARLVDAAALLIDESELTGESEPVRKVVDPLPEPELPVADRRDMVYMGTHVASGHGVALVCETGMDTELGRIAHLLREPRPETPLELELRSVGKRLAVLCVVIAAIVFGAGVLRGDAVTEVLLIAVSLAVAAIPEGLPAVVTLALALAVQRMAARNAIVRRLHAVETLGATNTICTDKTGTVTVNEMEVTSIATVEQSWAAELEPEAAPQLAWLKLIARNCTDAHEVAGSYSGDPTEVALLRFASGGDVLPRVDEIPFDPERKRMTVVSKMPDGRLVALVKGAPDLLIPLCTSYVASETAAGSELPMGPGATARITSEVEAMAAAGRRTLAAAYRFISGPVPASPGGLEKDLVLAGVFGIMDPPRPEVADAIARCHTAGIRVVMITGDHALTAAAVAREIGLVPAPGREDLRVVTAPELDRMDAAALAAQAGDIAVYARVEPEHKLRIIQALRADGAVVAMTGDGVNDAPALRAADIGVAMGLVGTDVAREAADMVLADDDFTTIVRAVEEGRGVFDNIRKAIQYLVSCNVSEVLIVFISMVFMSRPALLPLQILWINLVTDGFPALALAVDPAAPDLMSRRPRDTSERILSRRRLAGVLLQGSLMTAGGLVALAWAAGTGATLAEMRTVLFSTMVLTQLLHSFTFRVGTRGLFSSLIAANRWLLAAAVGSMLLQIVLLSVPPLAAVFGVSAPPPLGWLMIVACSLAPVLAIDLLKRLPGQIADAMSA